ncbi:hypothetical protein L0664_01200 [Octadecabacter sp. G9-8]|uniref:Uncharacterized protein n=1 Tax=Octadecabacter dasysiphoniae TaxID=2909341 RepID=A0ABS9CTC5_9RHOB|nr:hypothetical protein [Octadecabacter dasysiphoniae]MCF2869669.1 hypothetical protein [Octadecabacter dasysiphoniae]
MRQILLSLGMAVMLSACGDPLRNVTRLSAVDVGASAATVTQTPAEATNTGGGLFSRLLNRAPQDPTNAAIEAALADASVATEPSGDASDEVTEVATVQSTQDRPRRGLAGLFRRSPDTDVPRSGPDTQDVSAGTVMPFGEIARVCDIRGRALGTQVDTGGPFKIYDTIPNSTAPRPFYITGFDDNCARTFTGAVVVTGDVETHEFVRYRPSNERIPYSTTDNAYEALKASVCRVGRGQPCGERTARMDSNTHFITVYNFFGGTFSAVPTKWAQILVHDGEVVAMSIKDGAT